MAAVTTSAGWPPTMAALTPAGSPGGHGAGIAGQQERTAGQSGVQKVLADAAEELLDHHDGEEVTDEDHPQRGGGTGQTKASSMPVTTALRSPTDWGFFISLR